MDYRKKYLNRTGFQRAGLATLPRTRRVRPGYDQEFTLQKGNITNGLQKKISK